LASLAHLLPDFTIGAFGLDTTTHGGSHIGRNSETLAGIPRALSAHYNLAPEFASSHNESSLKLSLEAGTDPSDDELKSISPWNVLLRAAKSTGEIRQLDTEWWRELADGTEKRIDPNEIEDI
jgi:hypothetical protein